MNTLLLTLSLLAVPPPGASPRLHSLIRLDGTPTTSARTGERLLLLGTDLPADGFLSIAGQLKVEPASRQPHYYEFVVPRSSAGTLVGFIDLRRPSGTSYWGTFAGRLSGTFTILPPAPPPAPSVFVPAFHGLQDALGRPVTAPRAGDRVRATGEGFGASGRLWWGTTEVRWLGWSDTVIEFTLPPGLVPPRGTTLTIKRGDGRTTVDGVLGGAR